MGKRAKFRSRGRCKAAQSPTQAALPPVAHAAPLQGSATRPGRASSPERIFAGSTRLADPAIMAEQARGQSGRYGENYHPYRDRYHD